jgi:K+-transporting ATPase ATPase B chain
MAIPRAAGEVVLGAIRKCDPRAQWRNPVLLLVECGAALVTLIAIVELFSGGPGSSGGTALPADFDWTIAAWLWLTLLTANIAEALAEGRGRTETAALRSMRESTAARQVLGYDPARDPGAERAAIRQTGSADLGPEDIVLLEEGDVVPLDGEIVWGIASIDESAMTGESAPVIRESGGDRTGVTGGTRVLSDRIVVRITAPRGDTLVDRMIRLAEGAHRQKSPTELALFALLAAFSLSFVLVALTLDAAASPVAPAVSIPILVSVVVCLIPAEIAALMSVTGIASMHHLLRSSVLVSSGHALETASDITTVLLDKTGTVTEGNRQASDFVAVLDASEQELVTAALLASLDDPTSEGASTVRLAKARGADPAAAPGTGGRPVPFSAYTRMSGRDLPDGTSIRKGAESAILAWLRQVGTQRPGQAEGELERTTSAIARTGGTPLVIAIKAPDCPGRLLGVIHLKDVVKASVPARIDQLRTLGIRTIMVTGDNPLTAAAIAAEAGVDDYLADATPTDKLALIKQEQARGHFVAMSGDGTNDAPALAQADVGVAMNTATAAAKEAANMVILDDDPTRIVEIVEIGRRQMATRGALTTFNFANDLVRYVALFPALFAGAAPGLSKLNILGMHSPASAVLSTVIFSVVVIGILIPLAMVGVPYRMGNLGRALSRNLLYYGVGGILVAAAGIKLIDLAVGLLPGY